MKKNIIILLLLLSVGSFGGSYYLGNLNDEFWKETRTDPMVQRENVQSLLIIEPDGTSNVRLLHTEVTVKKSYIAMAICLSILGVGCLIGSIIMYAQKEHTVYR